LTPVNIIVDNDDGDAVVRHIPDKLQRQVAEPQSLVHAVPISL